MGFEYGLDGCHRFVWFSHHVRWSSLLIFQYEFQMAIGEFCGGFNPRVWWPRVAQESHLIILILHPTVIGKASVFFLSFFFLDKKNNEAIKSWIKKHLETEHQRSFFFLYSKSQTRSKIQKLT